MKRLPWLFVALIPATMGFFDSLNNSGNIIFWGTAFFCLLGSYFLACAIKRLWLRLLVALFIAAGFFVLDLSVAIYVGCSRHGSGI
jgi:hypothetical protein